MALPGSLGLGGDIFFDTTNNATPAIYVNAQEVMSPSASGLGFTTNGTQTGVVLKDATTTAFATKYFDCTGTGGNVKVSGGVKYDMCIVPPQLTTTGSIMRISLMISASPSVVGIDCGFVKGRVSGTGTSFVNLNDKASSTGAIITYGTGAMRWNPADYIKCGTLGTPTSSFAAKLKVDYFDDTSE